MAYDDYWYINNPDDYLSQAPELAPAPAPEPVYSPAYEHVFDPANALTEDPTFYGDQYSPLDFARQSTQQPYMHQPDAESLQGSNGQNQWKPPAQPSFLDKLLRGAGIQGQDGKTDISNPKTFDAIMRTGISGLSILNSLLGGNKPRGYKSAAQLQAELPGQQYRNWTPLQQASANAYFSGPTNINRARIGAGAMTSPVVASRGYASGGGIDMGAGMEASPLAAGEGPLSRLVEGPGGGQDDLVQARLSPGEYVFDAEAVSALGDGDNKRGAQLLDQMRQNLRRHKRAAPITRIPPMAKAPHSYLPKGR